MRKVVALFVIVCACGLVSLAQSAEKAAASSATAILFRTPTGGNVPDAGAWVTVLETSIKPPGGKDLFIGVSAQTEIENINANAATGAITSSAALGEILIRVLVDGVPATPGVVVLNAVEHVVITRLSTQLSNCREIDDIGPFAGRVDCTSTPGLLDTIFLDASANGFNFIMQDVSPSVHDIKVQAQFFAFASTGSAAEALMGPRTVTVEQVALDAQ